MTYMQVHGVGMNGAPYVAYYNMDMTDLDIEVGVPVAMVTEGNGRVESDVLPSGKYASTLHIGPYSTLEPAYRALMAYMENHNLKSNGPAYEFYLNDPQDTPENKLETKIQFIVGS
jgi:effector-binding domain-containing protein